jgi:hypothetical protein
VRSARGEVPNRFWCVTYRIDLVGESRRKQAAVPVASRTMKYGVRLVDDPRRRETAGCHVCRRAHDARSLPTSAVLTQTGRRGGFGPPFYRLMRIRGMSSSSTASCHILFCGSCSKHCRKVRRSSRRNAATRSSGLSLISRGPVSETICSASRILSSMLDLIGPGPSAISDSRSRSNVSIMKSHFPVGVFPPYFDRVPSNFGSSAMLAAMRLASRQPGWRWRRAEGFAPK